MVKSDTQACIRVNRKQMVYFGSRPFESDSSNSMQCSYSTPVIVLSVHRDPEKEMATHSSVLAWRIPWTEEPGGLPSMGSHRVRHD